MPKPQYSQKFRDAWLKDPALSKWIIKVESTAEPVIKCKFCSCVLANKYSDLKLHATTEKHKQNEKILFDVKQPKLNVINIDALEGVRIAECKLAMFISNHAAISTTDHLVPLCRSCFHGNESTHLKMHRTKCSAIIKNILGPHFENELILDIGDHGFSILIDESTDISVLKYLGCSIIYFSSKHGKIVTTFLDLAELESADAKGSFNCLLKIMTKHRLKLSKLQGLGTDNASVMVGINNGVYAKLKEYNPNLILIRCICHSIQLAASSATKELPRNIEFLIKETYDWFARSASRQLAYKNIYEVINDGQAPLKITQACATRWLSIGPAVSKIFTQWLELKTHFGIVATNDEKCYTAHLLHQMYSDKFNYAYICYLKPILEDINKVNKNFESNSADSTKLLDDLMILINSLVKKVVTPTSKFILFVDNIDDYVDPNCYLGYLFEVELRKMKEDGFKDEKNLRDRCLQFLKTLIKELINRVPDNIDILKQMSMLSVENVLKQVKPKITDLLIFLKNNPSDIGAIENEWSNISLIKWTNRTDTNAFWAEVLKYTDSNGEVRFKNLANLAISILSLPHSNAEVERLFSLMNIVKTKTRNKMKTDMLASILRVRAGLKREQKCCHNYIIPSNVLNKIKNMQTYELSNNENEDEFDIFI